MKYNALMFLGLSFFFAYTQASAKTIPCFSYKKFPALIGGCEGESCGILVYDKALLDVSVVDHPQTKKEIDTLKKCEQIKEFTPYIWLLQAGSATIEHSTKSLEKQGVKNGDIIKLISYNGEGFYGACIRSKFIDISSDSNDGGLVIKDVKSPKTESWVEVETPRSKKGYIRGNAFYMGHGGFDVSKLCGDDHPFGADHTTVQTKFLATLVEQIQKSCATNADLIEGRPRCQKSDEIWRELKKISPKLATCDGFEINKVLGGLAWIGYLNCPKSSGSTEKWQLNLSCQGPAANETPESTKIQTESAKPKITCYLGS